MHDMDKIKTAFERYAAVLEKRPTAGQDTGITTTKVVNGLKCEVKAGTFTLTTDMPEAAGGTAQGPTPGTLGRAALGSCLAIGYMMHAARLGVPIDTLEVEVQADWDDRGVYLEGNDIPAGYLEVRYLVTVESSASEADVMRVIEAGDKYSPYLDIFSRAQSMKREVQIKTPVS